MSQSAFLVEIVDRPTGWDFNNVSTLIIAGLALVVSVISAGFNIWSWRKQGAVAQTSIELLHEDALWLSVSNIGRLPARVEPIIVSDAQTYDWCRLPIQDFSFSDKGFEKIMEPGEYLAGSVPLQEFAIIMHDQNRKLKDIKIAIRFAGKNLRIGIPRRIRKKIIHRIREEAWEICQLRQSQSRRHKPCLKLERIANR